MIKSFETFLIRALPFVSIIIILVWGIIWWPYTIDDSYISYRYADNFSKGLGLVFNPGEHVEGYSCPLWVLTLSSIVSLGGDIIVFSKIIGLLSALLLPILTFLTVFNLCKNKVLAGISALWCAVIPDIHIYACSGMETVPFAASIAFSVTLMSYRLTNTPLAIGTLLSLICVALLRPEGLLLGPLLAVIGIIITSDRKLKLLISIFFLFFLGFLLFRFMYYDSLLPNTFLAKPSPIINSLQHSSLLDSIQLLFYRTFIFKNGPVSLFLKTGGIFVLFFLLYGAMVKEWFSRTLAIAAVAVTGFIYLLYSPQDWMTGHRFAMPYIMPIITLSTLGVYQITCMNNTIPKRIVFSATAIIVLFWFFINTTATAGYIDDYSTGTITNTALNASKYSEIGTWLHDNADSTDLLLAYEIGAIGFYSHLKILDHEGLIDKVIAGYIKQAGGYDNLRYIDTNKICFDIVKYCVNRNPDWFLVRSSADTLFETGKPVPENCADEKIQNLILKEFGPHMVLKKIFPMNKTGTDKYLLLKRCN
jgi:hypothetical protein